MILERLTVTNFRAYHGTHHFSIAMDPRRNTTIIQGINGAGKTTLLQALNFVLYGARAIDSARAGTKSETLANLPLVNLDELRKATPDKPARGSVVLEYTHRNIKYKLSRGIKGCLENQRFRATAPENVTLSFIDLDGNTKLESEYGHQIEAMLPSAIRTFFFFDGDRISEFTKPGSEYNEKISKAVRDVLQIEPLAIAIRHLNAVAKENRRKIDAIPAPETARLKLDIQMRELDIKGALDKRASVRAELSAIPDEITRCDEELISISEEQERALKRKGLEGQRALYRQQLASARRSLLTLSQAAIPALLASQVSGAIDMLKGYKDRRVIPARIYGPFLEELLRDNTCICSRSLAGNPKAREALERLYASQIPNALQDQAVELLSRLRVESRDDRSTAITEALESIDSLKRNIVKIDLEIEHLGAEIDESAIEKARAINQKRAGFDRRHRELEAERLKLDRDIGTMEKSLGVEQSRLRSAASKRTETQRLSAEWKLASDCVADLERAKARFEMELRQRLSDEATAIMKGLVSDTKKFFFKRIEIAEGFLLKVMDHKGFDVRANLSSGETQVVSLAFMLAMTRLGGQEAPLVIDTPLARLDESVRVNVAERLPELTPQLLLLVTDSEFTSDLAKVLKPVIGYEYEIVPGELGPSVKEGLEVLSGSH